jgi:hypothetical protein
VKVDAPYNAEVVVDDQNIENVEVVDEFSVHDAASSPEEEQAEAEASEGEEASDEFQEEAEGSEGGEEQTEEAGEEEGEQTELTAEEAVEEEEALDAEVVEEKPKLKAPTRPAPPKNTAPRVMDATPRSQALGIKSKGQELAELKATKSSSGNRVKGDFLISRVLLMQATSDLVKARKAFPGQIVTSPEGLVIGGISQPGEPSESFNILPLSIKETWTVMDGANWVRTEDRTDENNNLPWQFEEEGKDLKRLQTIEVIALLENEVHASLGEVEVDEDGVPVNFDQVVVMPRAFSFRSKSFAAGKAISTHFTKVEAVRKQYPNARPFHVMLALGCEEESNEHGDFYVFSVGGGTPTPKAYRAMAAGWYDQLQSANIVIEGEDQGEERAAENLQARPAPKGKGKF